MRVVVPLSTGALARVDKLDRMVKELSRHAKDMSPCKARRELEKTIKQRRAELDQVCNDALMRAKGIGLIEGYKVTRAASGKITGAIWDSPKRPPLRLS